jgi:sRNA-binding protein
MQATHAALAYLARRWPEAFADDAAKAHPLAVGARERVLEASIADPSAPDRKWLARALALWCGSIEYLAALARATPRVHLTARTPGRSTPIMWLTP